MEIQIRGIQLRDYSPSRQDAHERGRIKPMHTIISEDTKTRTHTRKRTQERI